MAKERKGKKREMYTVLFERVFFVKENSPTEHDVLWAPNSDGTNDENKSDRRSG